MFHRIKIRRYEKGDKLVLEASGDFFRGMKSLEFRFPGSEAENITDRADPFVHALLFPMMECGGEFEIDGNVSRSVLDNVTMFNRIWNVWLPESYKLITIHAAHVPDDDYRPENRKLITAFSGGLDAAYTAYKYKKGLDPHFKYELDKSIMLLGADIPFREREQFAAAFGKAKEMTDSIGIKLIPVETNYRLRQACNWNYECGSVVMSALEFFSKRYFHGAAAGDDPIGNFTIPWGSNPVTDQYLASDTFRFQSDGHEHSRTERAAMIKDWEEALRNLRVCWRNPDRSENCGKCEKCVRTKLNFMAAGVTHVPFIPNDLTKEELRRIREELLKASYNITFYSEILHYDERHHNLTSEWRALLCECVNSCNKMASVEHEKKKHHSLWWHIKNRRF